MLSLGSRDDGRKGIGLGFRSREGAMEENELEEGEAFSGHEDDACIDPDIALSYIDEKLQDVLGHFQKDFEGGVSAENLGAKFGGYGSFLPSYQRSPSVLPQPRSPPRPSNNTVSKSPYNSSVEYARQNPSVPRVTSISKNSTPSVAQPSNPGRKENCISSVNAGACVPHLDSNNKPVNVSDQKTLKVRIKVGPDNTLARSNAAIYSGLGLDTSPSSSPEVSPDASAGLSPELRDAPGESPLSILQVMTCLSIPGGYLLSPLHENLFQLTENENLFSRKTGILGSGAPEMRAAPDMTLSMGEMKDYSDKKIKLDEKNFRSTEEENFNCEGDTTQMLKKEMDVDAPGSKRVVTSALKMSLQSCSRSADLKAERQVTGDAAKGSSRALSVSKEANRLSVKDRLPLPDSAKDDQYISMGSTKSGGVNNLGDGTIHAKGKLNSKTSLLENDIEERNPNHKDISSDTRRDRKNKNQRSYGLSKLNGDEYKGRDDHVAGHAEHMKQMPAQKVTSHEKDAEKMLQGNDQVHEGKKRQMGSHNNSAPSVESIQSRGNMRASSSLVPKEKKKSSHARRDHSENKSKMLKSCKETNGGHSRESHREVGNINVQRVEKRADLSEPFMFTEKSMERSGIKKDVNLQPEPTANPPVSTSSMCTAPISDAVAPLDAPPVVIKENWVCCDKCQKWRLLPYGADPDNLPKKWKCSMQLWLPGLNKCSISEEETQKAFNALYILSAPETGANLNGHHDVTASSITSTDAQHFDRRLDHDTQSVPSTGKKKSGLVAASNMSKNPVSKNFQSSVRSRSLTDVSEYPVETNSSIKAGLGITSKSVDFTTEKHNHKRKEKHKIPGHYSGEGDFVAKSGKHLKSKSKREVNQDGFRTSKKVRKENSDYLIDDRLSDLDMTVKAAPDMDNGLSAKVTGKILQNYSDHSSSKDSKSEQRGNLLASIKNSKDPTHIYTNGDSKVHFWGSDVEKSGTLDYAAKKRKVKEWQESQAHQETAMSPQHALDRRLKESSSEGELRKQKKAKVSKSEGKESSMNNIDGKSDKKGRSTKILLSGSREQRSDGTGGGRVGGKGQTGYQETAVPRQALDATDPLKRDMTYIQLPTAATSSSSKVSGSRKSKANLQEARGSPVESVSSSPLRISSTEKISIRGNSAAKDDMVNLDPSFMGSPKRCPDGELGSDQSGTLRKETGSSVPLKSLESHRAAESGVLGSMGETCHYLEKEASHVSGGNNKDGLYLKRGAQVDLSPAEFEGANAVGDSENILGHDNKYLFDGQEKDTIDDDQDDLNNHCRSNGSGQRKSDKSSGFKERNRKSNSDVNKGKTKAFSSLSDKKELYSTKNGRNFHSEADLICNDDSNRHDDPRDENYNFPEKNEDNLGKKKPSSKWSHFDRRDDHSNGLEENLDAQNKDFNSRVTFVGANCKSNLQENLQPASYPSENPASHSLLNHMDRSDMASVRGTSQSVQPPKDKSEVQNSGQIVPTPIKGSRPDAYPIDVANGDAFKLAKQSRKPDSEICLHPSSLRQVTPNSHDSSPMRKDVPSVASAVLKEARDLKHSANRLKTEGLDHESIGLYFEAALKFLYCASLLEPHSAESAKHGEMNPSMLMISIYSDTARLCEYCAHEYERYKEMAAAALAYKCIEVAYMKVAYYKHSAAIKDRHELLTALQTVLPGESPSSSASDVDNLNNQGAVDKAASAKAAGSPQIAGNHVIAARNRPNFMRLLSYANDLNCAFDATKRFQNAIAAASVSLEKDGVDGLSSVRKVLDFNFHNVEGLLRLVRLSMESISC